MNKYDELDLEIIRKIGICSLPLRHIYSGIVKRISCSFYPPDNDRLPLSLVSRRLQALKAKGEVKCSDCDNWSRI